MSQQKANLRGVADALIAATNAFDVARVLNLFAPDAVIDDPSTGHRFDGHAGIREYIERYFIGYQTVTGFLSIKSLGQNRARLRVDFTGDFGHEIGLLEMLVNETGLIARIDANLESHTKNPTQ
ncbi:nuclear transport factor 2 family protein [Variovorax sp. YR216]|uniref:YybH family protein n=1 Tax=Variovorax sp. YR216 TaxID=1882828 RepID=UPI0008969A04|nr:nuclear transport factor 2 family protein [Variovorax sp. YR216]SEB23533.1 SnoaL-like domain-containing protein [Variovorax sp. YR216]